MSKSRRLRWEDETTYEEVAQEFESDHDDDNDDEREERGEGEGEDEEEEDGDEDEDEDNEDNDDDEEEEEEEEEEEDEYNPTSYSNSLQKQHAQLQRPGSNGRSKSSPQVRKFAAAPQRQKVSPKYNTNHSWSGAGRDHNARYVVGWAPGATNGVDTENNYDDENLQSGSEDEDADADDDSSFLYQDDASGNDEMPHHERMEWRQMLASVLKGDVIRSEKERFNSAESIKENFRQIAGDIWWEIRAVLRSRTVHIEKRIVEMARRGVDEVLQQVIDFKVKDGEISAEDQVADLLVKVDQCESLYPTLKFMATERPLYDSPEYKKQIEALTAWFTLTRSIRIQFGILKEWTGTDDLQFGKTGNRKGSGVDSSIVANDNNSGHGPKADDVSFIERILKESALHKTFQKRTLVALNILLTKARKTMIENHEAFERMQLPGFPPFLNKIINLPTALVEEALRFRLEYAQRLTEPTILIVDQMRDDFHSLLKLAQDVKVQYEDISAPEPGWYLAKCINDDYDEVLRKSLQFYFKLVLWKLRVEIKMHFRESEILEQEWEFLKTVCFSVPEGDWETAEQFCSLTNKLLHRTLANFDALLKQIPPTSPTGLPKEYMKALQNSRLRARKLLRFAKDFMSQFENAAEYQISPSNFPAFINALAATNHFLVYTSVFERDGIYIIASPSLRGEDDLITITLRCSFSPSQPPKIGGEDYILILHPQHAWKWAGEKVDLPMDNMDLDMKRDRIRMVTRFPSKLSKAKENLFVCLDGLRVQIIREQRAHIARVNRELMKVRGTVFRLAELAITGTTMIRDAVRGTPSQDLVEETFNFASDFGHRSSQFLEGAARNQLDLKRLRLAIDWVSFICDDCIPTDRKTFRWAVLALEFAALMTRGINILSLSEPEWTKLQSKVATCIALLISHFDVLGARSTLDAIKVERERQEALMALSSNLELGGNNPGTDISLIFVRDEWVRQLNELDDCRAERLREIKKIGRVLDEMKPEDRNLVFLAPSSNQLSFRWQQGKFLGSGTFGSVYMAINLDTSEPMAVKEIRFQDTASLSALHKSIKEEMKVMEMLHHDNIVKYYGMEVHRDKVYIFMEYCEHGSLGKLLENGGRIDDENYIVDYTYQMLCGLVYLHENNIVHRDIKPDNILLDHLGHIKFVDFGAAKILAKGQKTMGRTTMNLNVNSLTGTPMYMAPEVIKGEDKGRKGSMDIWSLACCVVEMATGRRPWANLDNEWAVMYHVVTGHPPLPDSSQLSEAGIDFLKQCFTRSTTKRPSAKELLEHPWITGFLASFEDEGEPASSLVNGSMAGSISSNVTRSSLGSMNIDGENVNGALRSIIPNGRSLPRPVLSRDHSAQSIKSDVSSSQNGVPEPEVAASSEAKVIIEST